MAIYPGAVFKPTPFGGRTPRNRQGRGMLHVAVSRARSLPPSSERATWHLYVALDGYCEQYVDTEYRAYGGAEGNDDQIIVETAGGTGSSKELNAEKWTPAQAERIADIMRWEASQPGGAPLELLPDARAGRRGWGPHRLGIQHSGGPRPGWWQPGSELWSSALGKECPGDAKVAQIPSIVARAEQIRGNRPTTTPQQEGTDMLLARVKGTAGPVWIFEGNDDASTNNGGLVGSLVKAGVPLVDLTREEIQEIQNDCRRRRAVEDARQTAVVSAVLGKFDPVDEDKLITGLQALAADRVSSLSDADIDRIAAASAGGLTREDVKQVVRGVFAAAAA